DGLDPGVATFTEPLACALRALRRARVTRDDALLVAGLGCSGLLVTAAAAAGTRYVLEPRADRLAHALQLGARGHAGEPVDVAFVCTPAPEAVAAAANALRPGGRLLIYATPSAPGTPVPVDWWTQFTRELTLVTSWSAGPGDMRDALSAL